MSSICRHERIVGVCSRCVSETDAVFERLKNGEHPRIIRELLTNGQRRDLEMMLQAAGFQKDQNDAPME